MSDNSLALIKKTLNSTEVMQRFAAFMGSSDAAYYINSVILAVANNKDLQECTPNSIVFSALRAASLQLSCDPALGEAHLVPFNNTKKGVKEATFIPGYKGLRNLATRTGKYRYINAGKLRNGEQWVEDELTGKCSIGGKAIDNTKLGWFAFFEMFNGYAKGLYMTTEQIHDHAREFSKTYSNPRGKWQNDPESMEKKTVLRLLLVRWGDLGKAGNAFKEDEILEGEFHDELVPVTERAEDEPEPVKHTEAENMSALGFDAPIQPPEYDLPEQDGETPIASLAPMSLEEAQDRLTPKNKRYGDLSDEDLHKLAEISGKHYDEPGYQDNILACQLILKARAEMYGETETA